MAQPSTSHGRGNRGLAADANPGGGFEGHHLGPVGSRILAETLIGLLWMDPSSVLHARPGFRPLAKIAGTTSFTLASLAQHALS